MSLRDWQDNGWLLTHRTSWAEVADLLAAADHDLADAGTAGLSPVWTIAALDLILGHQVGDLSTLLDRCRTMRHDATYEGARSISRAEADELIGAVQELRGIVVGWLKERHPEIG